MKNNIIKLNKKFYNLKAVKETVKVYKKLANFDIKESRSEIKINLKNADSDIKNVIEDEFCNYVLSEMRNE
jgi:hypothetical protein